jgi:hypothetical protein
LKITSISPWRTTDVARGAFSSFFIDGCRATVTIKSSDALNS